MLKKLKRHFLNYTSDEFFLSIVLEFKKITTVMVMGSLAVVLIEQDSRAYYLNLTLIMFAFMLYLTNLELSYYKAKDQDKEGK